MAAAMWHVSKRSTTLGAYLSERLFSGATISLFGNYVESRTLDKLGALECRGPALQMIQFWR